MRQQRAEGFRRKLFTDNDAGGTTAFEALVGIFILFAAGKGHDLRGDIGAQLLLAGAALNVRIHSRLILTETDKLQGNDIRALMQ